MRVDRDDEWLVDALRQAGTEVELDRARVRRKLDEAIADEQLTRARRRSAGRARGRRGAGRTPVLPVIMVAAASVVAFIAAVLNGQPRTDSVTILGGEASPSSPSTTATLGGGISVTAISRPTGGETGTRRPTAERAVKVTPMPVGSSVRMPGGNDTQWLVLAGADGVQVPGRHEPRRVGPAQVMGSGQSTVPGPFTLSWAADGAGPTVARTGSWLTVPDQERGVPSALRIPVRLERLPATITLHTGTVGGPGRVNVTLARPDGRFTTLVAELPACGQAACPAVVTVRLDPSDQPSGSAEVMIELTARGRGARVGLAAVQVG